ncbi:CRYD protein, partial [Nothocercus julius]|nr:CRYD protein [Nothocercus julius]
KVDYTVYSNYGNWLYSAGVGNDPRDHRRFNTINQGLDYDGSGDYVQLWVPEPQELQGGDIHAPWALSSASLSQAGITLGETYPQPVVTAPEWSRHTSHRPQGRGPHPTVTKGAAHPPMQHKDRGIDFCFSRKKHP